MLNRLNISLFLILLAANVLFAQNIRLGFQIESNGTKVSHGSEIVPYSGSIIGFQFNASIFPFDDRFALEVRAAAMGEVNYYSGREMGLMAKYFFLQPAYLIGGVNWHKIDSDSRFGYYVYGSNLSMPALGIGVSPVKQLNIEFLYLHTGNPEVGQYWGKLNDPHVPVHLKYVLKLGVGLSFSIFSW